MSINGCINEQNVVFPYNAIRFILKREENSYTCYVGELEDIILSETSQTQKGKYYMTALI